MKNFSFGTVSNSVSGRHARIEKYLWAFSIILLVPWMEGCHPQSKHPKASDTGLPVKVKPMLISQLGAEHFGNAIYRHGIEGPRIAASGNRILEWPVQASAPTAEVVPPDSESYQNGACALDVNGDGFDEMIVGQSSGKLGTDLLWFEEIAGQKNWKKHLIAYVKNRGGEEGIHDIMPVEIRTSKKNLRGVAVVVNRKHINWYQIPDDATQPWTEHMIADLGEHGAKCAQSGLVPGDISGNGRQDLVCGNFWMECPADPTSGTWRVRRYSNWDRRATPKLPGVPEWVSNEHFGGMNQLDLGDMNSDGNLDIVSADAEIPEARVGIFCQDKSNPDGLWNETIVDTNIYCPHSLAVTDVNADNLPDILVGEMTAGGWYFPRNSDPRLYLYLNQGNLKFQKYVLYTGLGTHMLRMASKQDHNKIFVFAADEIQSWYKDMTTHVVGWIISPKKGQE